MEDNIYPLINEEDFQEKLLSNPEFKFYKYDKPTYINNRNLMKSLSDNMCSKVSGYIYKQVQLFLSNYMSLNTPYNSILLYHGVGVGKTCTSLLIADNFKEYVKKHNKKIIILTKPAIQNTFKNEIFNHEDFTNNVDKNMFKCLSQEFKDDWTNFKNLNDESNYSEFSSNIINEYFEIYGYLQFVNHFKKQIETNREIDKKKVNNIFSNTVIIIDEVHNLRDEDDSSDKNVKESKEFLFNIINNLDNPIKLILLSATPMYDKFDEIEFILNLLLLNDKRQPLINNVFESFLNETDKIKKNNLEKYIIENTNSYVSYLKGNDPLLFPKLLYPEEAVNLFIDNQKNYMTVLLNYMKSPQKEIYNKFVSSNNIMEAQKYSNITYPKKQENNDIIKENIFNFDELFTYNKQSDSYIINLNYEASALDLLNNLDKYSAKLNSMIKNISEYNIQGKIFIYSQYIDPDNGGGKLIALLLEYIGYQRKIVKKNKLKISNSFDNSNIKRLNKFYIRLDGSTSTNDRNFYINEFNQDNNINGDNIQIIIGSTNLFEGVSLYNLREVHILDPWYNKSRYEQILGRGYRQCSHKNLPFEKRNLTIYNYVAISDKSSIQEFSSDSYKIINSQTKDVDIRKIYLSNSKQEDIMIIENLLKYNSIDCLLNKNINMIEYNIQSNDIDYKTDVSIIKMIDSRNQTKLIKFNESDYSCFNTKLIEKQDIDRENILLNSKLIENIKYYIKSIFIKYTESYYTIENIQELIKENYFSECNDKNSNLYKCNHININLIKLALQDLLINKELFYNRFNITGYLIINGDYFMFNSLDNDKYDLPYEILHYPYKTKISNINNFHNYSIKPTFKLNYSIKPITTKTLDLSKISTKTNTPQDIYNLLSEQTLEKNIDSLLNQCYFSDFFKSLENNNIMYIYRYLWTTFNPVSGKNNPDLNNIINEEDLFDIKKLSFKNMIKSCGLYLFNIPDLSDNIESYENLNDDSFIDFMNDIFYINYDIFFIFNFSFIILYAIKCVFYKHYIENIPLNDLTIFERNLLNNYDYLILNKSSDNFIFKFIDYSKDSLNNYDYNDIQYILIEFNKSKKVWKHYSPNISDKKKTIKTNSGNYDIYKVTIELKQINDFTNPSFFKEQLNLDDNEFDNFYKTFSYNKYTNYNNSYFNYCGSPIDSSNRNIQPLNILQSHKLKQIPKFSNIIGLINIRQTDSNFNLSPISRIMFNLGLIYSVDKKGFNVYLKGNHNATFKVLENEKLSENQQILHIIYCIIDQIVEFNKLIIYETILQRNNIYNEIWNHNIDDKPSKYTLDEFINFDFKLNKFDFSDTNYEKLQKYMLLHFNIQINTKQQILENLESIKSKLFNYNNILILLQQIYNYESKPINKSKVFVGGTLTKKWINSFTASSDKNKYTKEFYITKLLIIILYHLDKIKFYNKRWLLNLFESALANNKLLDIEARGNGSYHKSSASIIADSASIPSANTYIQSKTVKKRSVKWIQSDSS